MAKNTNQLPARIAKARLQEWDTLLAIMQKANDYTLEKSGDRLWTTSRAADTFHDQVVRGTCYVLRDEVNKIAGIIVLDDSDEWTWNEAGLDDRALYIHKLMKDPATNVKHIGPTLLRFAADQAVRRNKTILRADTKSSMETLLQFYEKYGFERIGNFAYKNTGFPGTFIAADPHTVIRLTTDSAFN